ncbi:hypothetical protein [Kitasatospora sp. NPDC005751]|uniref:hypothetical protein n=1 Tax=Kitasatospora sp. NPDC005751 TaxID=3157064 RepID=UPI0033E03EE4
MEFGGGVRRWSSAVEFGGWRLLVMDATGVIGALTGVIVERQLSGTAAYRAAEAALAAWLESVRAEHRRQGFTLVDARLPRLDTGFAQRPRRNGTAAAARRGPGNPGLGGARPTVTQDQDPHGGGHPSRLRLQLAPGPAHQAARVPISSQAISAHTHAEAPQSDSSPRPASPTAPARTASAYADQT